MNSSRTTRGNTGTPIIFRDLHKAQQPEPGELWMCPRLQVDRDRRATALLVLEKGLDALRRGSGDVRVLVVDAGGVQPNFDEMLAACFVQRLLVGQQMSEGLRSLGEYARLLLKGLTPTNLAVEQTVEGIYQAIRNLGGEDLSKAEVGRAFLARWQMLSERLFQAAEAGTDIFSQSLFASDSNFAEEQAYLRRDEDVYRQDVERGERWKICLPGGPALSAGLLLFEPRSLLFAFWSRRDRQTPTGTPYQLLAVDWGKGEWIFSTDPVAKLSLKPLAERLQAIEARRNPQAANNPWYDGRDRQHSLVAAPHGGTKLSNRQVRHIVRVWTKPKREWKPTLKVTVVAAALATLVVVVYQAWKSNDNWLHKVVAALFQRTGERKKPANRHVGNVPPLPYETVSKPRPGPVPSPERTKHEHKLYRCMNGKRIPIDLDNRQILRTALFGSHHEETLQPDEFRTIHLEEENCFKHKHDVLLKVHLRVEDSQLAMSAANLSKVFVNGIPLKKKGCSHELQGELEVELPTNLKTQNSFDLQIHNTSDKPAKMVLDMNCVDDFRKVNLHVLAVGVSKYASFSKPLPYAANDAKEMVEELKHSGNGRPFQRVIFHPEGGLTDGQATRDQILQHLQELQNADEHDLALIFFSGHGIKLPKSDYYFFLPYDYKHPYPYVSAVGWDRMEQILGEVKCRVVVIMDTCHSGAIGKHRTKGDTDAEVRKAVDCALKNFALAKVKRGIILLAACLGDEQAIELDKYKHGALTEIILETLRKHDKTGVITLTDIKEYAEVRVKELVKGFNSQDVVLQPLNDIKPEQIPLAVAPKTPSN